jgi:hypothetical protein
MTLSIYDTASPETLKLLISGDTITVLEYTSRVLCVNGRVALEGEVYSGPYKEKSVWIPLYEAVQKAVTEIIGGWIIKNVDTFAPQLIKYPYRFGLVSLKAQMGIMDSGQPYLKAKYISQSPTGDAFVASQEGERARLMCQQLAGTFIEGLEKEVPK